MTTKLTFEETVEIIKARMLDLARQDGIPLDASQGSDIDRFARTAALASDGSRQEAEYLADQIFPATASDEYVLLHAERRGLTRKPAVKATGFVMVLHTDPSSTDATHIPPGTEFTSITGQTYVSTADEYAGKTANRDLTPLTTKNRLATSDEIPASEVNKIVSVAGGYGGSEILTGLFRKYDSVDIWDIRPSLQEVPDTPSLMTGVNGTLVPVEAVEPGEQGNYFPRQELTWSPIGGLSDVAICGHITGGRAEETIEELRQRIITFDYGRPDSKNVAGIWLRAIEGGFEDVEKAFVYANELGQGHHVIYLGSPGLRMVSDDIKAQVVDHISEWLPAGDTISAVWNSIGADWELNLFYRNYSREQIPPIIPNIVSVSGSTITHDDPAFELEPDDLVLLNGRYSSVRTTVIKQVIAADNALQNFTVDLSDGFVPEGRTQFALPEFESVIEKVHELIDSTGPCDCLGNRFPPALVTGENNISKSDVIAKIKELNFIDDIDAVIPGAYFITAGHTVGLPYPEITFQWLAI